MPSRGETLSHRSGAGREPGEVDWRSIRSRSGAGFGSVQSVRRQLATRGKSFRTVRRAGRELDPGDRRSTGGGSQAGGNRLERSGREGGSCDEEGRTGFGAARGPLPGGVAARSAAGEQGAREIRCPGAGRWAGDRRDQPPVGCASSGSVLSRCGLPSRLATGGNPRVTPCPFLAARLRRAPRSPDRAHHEPQPPSSTDHLQLRARRPRALSSSSSAGP